MNKYDLLEQLKTAISGEDDAEVVVDIAERIVEEGVDARVAVDAASEAIRSVGDRFETGELYLPDLMIAGKKMEQCMAVLRPHIKADEGSRVGGRVVIGTAFGDIHDIGKNLVATMLTVGGFEVTDLGVSVPPLDFVNAAKEKRADIIALSALMTTSLPYQQEVIDLLKEMGLREKYYIIVGGGPITAEFASEIGADGWADNAAAAIGLCDALLTSEETPPVAMTFVV